jgi:beta-glucanase (GH16 family)
MRGAILVTGILAAVVVIAIGVVATVAKGSSPGAGQSAQTAQAAATQQAGATVQANSATAQASGKPSGKPTPTASKTKAAPRTSATGPAQAPSTLTVPAGWQLAFDVGFAGSSLNTGLWATCYDWATGTGCTNNPKTEKEWYLPSQVHVSGGVLNLAAQRETTAGTDASGAAETYSCRSGMVTSKPGFNFTYGLIQVTAKVPYGPGLWPALWLAASNDDWPPELDIMEHWYSEQQYKIYDHTVGTQYVGGPVPTPVDLSAGFHTFSLLWTKDRVTWYLDGTQEFTTTDHVPQQAMYFIANVADRNPDGDTSTSLESGSCAGTMQISSVKVWQP